MFGEPNFHNVLNWNTVLHMNAQSEKGEVTVNKINGTHSSDFCLLDYNIHTVTDPVAVSVPVIMHTNLLLSHAQVICRTLQTDAEIA